MNDVIHRKRARRILGIFEKSVSWVLASEEDGWFSGLAEIRPLVCGGVPHVVVVGGRWKSQHRKIVYLSPYVEKSFNSTVIKSFLPELSCRKCFLCFGIPMLSMYEVWKLSISHIRTMGMLHNSIRTIAILVYLQISSHLKMKLPIKNICKQMIDVRLWLSYCNTWKHLTACKERA